MNLDRIYTNLIMEHNKSGHNKGEIESNYVERGHNPNCGDDITVQLLIEDGKVKNGAFVGIGCAISTASASILMDLIKGLDVGEAEKLVTNYLRMIKGEELTDDEKDELEEASCLKSVSV